MALFYFNFPKMLSEKSKKKVVGYQLLVCMCFFSVVVLISRKKYGGAETQLKITKEQSANLNLLWSFGSMFT